MRRLVNALILFFAPKQKQSPFQIREDKVCGGFIASTTVEPIVRATGDTEQEAMENLLSDLEEIKRVTEQSGDPFQLRQKQYV